MADTEDTSKFMECMRKFFTLMPEEDAKRFSDDILSFHESSDISAYPVIYSAPRRMYRTSTLCLLAVRLLLSYDTTNILFLSRTYRFCTEVKGRIEKMLSFLVRDNPPTFEEPEDKFSYTVSYNGSRITCERTPPCDKWSKSHLYNYSIVIIDDIGLTEKEFLECLDPSAYKIIGTMCGDNLPNIGGGGGFTGHEIKRTGFSGYYTGT